MRKKYDFSKSRRNPYAKHFKQQVTLLLDKEATAYFKSLATETGIAYQVLINLYLRDCMQHERRPNLQWIQAGGVE